MKQISILDEKPINKENKKKIFEEFVKNKSLKEIESLIQEMDYVDQFMYMADILWYPTILFSEDEREFLNILAAKIEMDKLTIDQKLKLFDYLDDNNKSEEVKLIKKNFEKYYKKKYFFTYYHFDNNLDQICFLYNINDKSYFEKIVPANYNIYEQKITVSLFIYAAENGGSNIVKNMLNDKRLDINAINDIGNSFYDYAVKNNNKEIIQLLTSNLRHDLNLQDQYRIKKLDKYLAYFDYTDKLTKLLKHPRIINTEILNTRYKDGETILHRVIRLRDMRLISSLLKDPAINVNIQDKYGNTALHLVTKSTFFYSALLLLDHKNLDINIQDNAGNTCLHLAAQCEKNDLIQILFEKTNLDPNIRNKEGKTALNLAKGKMHFDLEKLLLQRQNKIENAPVSEQDFPKIRPDIKINNTYPTQSSDVIR